jgi:hypothetical protein
MSPISRIDRSHSTGATHRVTPVARIRSRTETVQSSLTLNLRTAEGDTVELSFDTRSLKQLESAKVRTSEGNATYSRATQTDTTNFRAQVTGDLNQQELADIGSLLQSLQSGETPASSPSSIDSYTGSLRQTTSVTKETFRLYA